MTVQDIKKAISGTDFEFYGLRIDDYCYKIGDTANKSHQLFQDPEFDEEGELIYPEGEGIYSGYYDAGELDGTCAIGFRKDDDESIEMAIKEAEGYIGGNIYILASDVANYGNDCMEIIMVDAEVLFVERNL